MNRIFATLLLVFSLSLLFSGCSGYYFPGVYDGPAVSIYMPTWQNRTDRLGIDNTMYNSLSSWFLKSDKLNLTKEKEGADMVLAGEIISIHLPGIGWNSSARTTDVKVELVLRYVLKDLKTGKIVWEAPREVWTEDYNTVVQNAANEDEAIEQILDDVAEKIYLGTISRIRKMSRK